MVTNKKKKTWNNVHKKILILVVFEKYVYIYIYKYN